MVDTIQTYLQQLEINRYSPETLIKYEEVLRQLEAFCVSSGTTLLEADKQTIRAFRLELLTRNLKAISVNGYTAILKAFYEYLVKTGVIQKNPARIMRKIPEPGMLPSFVTEKELLQLLSSIDTDPSLTLKDVTMFELLLGTGMRVSELCDLECKDIIEWGRPPTEEEIRIAKERNPHKEPPKWINGLIHIRKGKGSFARTIPFPRQTDEVLRSYMAQRTLATYDSPFLFCNLSGGRLNRGNVYKRIRPILDQVASLQENKKKGPHTLRHTYASLLVNRGANTIAVRDLLGHKSITTTQRYTHLEIEALVRIHEKHFPR